MREYIIEKLPFRPIVRIEQVPPDALPRIIAAGLKLMKDQGKDVGDPGQHLMNDATKSPRVVMLLVASQAIRELELHGHPPTKDVQFIAKWLHSLPDEAIHSLFRECILRVN